MKFTDSHEWISVEGDIGTVGITHFAKKELGDVVYVDFPVIGRNVKVGEETIILESTKAAADIYAPVSGEIIAVNSEHWEKINHDPEGEGWLFKVRLLKMSELDDLMDERRYSDLIR